MFLHVSSVPEAPVIDSVEVTFNQSTGIITAVTSEPSEVIVNISGTLQLLWL